MNIFVKYILHTRIVQRIVYKCKYFYKVILLKYYRYIILIILVSIAANILNFNRLFGFIFTALSIIVLAAMIGNFTEQVVCFTSPKIGGLITATMSNLPELLIGFFAIRAGLYNLVLASIAGAIIGNMLLVLGFSVLLGGLKRKYQVFDKNLARSNFILLFFSAMSIIIPIALKYAMKGNGISNLNNGLTYISFFIALILLITYISGFIFAFVTHKNMFESQKSESPNEKCSFKKAIASLIACGILIAIESEFLVNSVEHVIENYNISEVFIGIVILPILGNIAENSAAVIMAIKDKIDVSIEIAIGSSIQIALFVAPVLILTSFIIGRPMIYVYEVFETVSILISIVLSLYIFQDGKTNWLEGLILLGSYIILGSAFLFL